MRFRYSIKTIEKIFYYLASTLGFCMGIFSLWTGIFMLRFSIIQSLGAFLCGLFFCGFFLIMLFNFRLELDSQYL